MNQSDSVVFQDHMPGNVCFGCGKDHPDGLHIKSRWEGLKAVCEWIPEEKYHGWAQLLNGGVIATLIDCHCMGAAMADAYRREGRSLDSLPEYRYATGSLQVKYLKPTSTLYPVRLEAMVTEVKGRKTVLTCDLISQGERTATAEVVAILVYDGNKENNQNPFKN